VNWLVIVQSVLALAYLLVSYELDDGEEADEGRNGE
jgi:hypothetical protein